VDAGIRREPLTKAEVELRHWSRIVYHDAIRRGKLVRLPCEVCGKKRVDGHHSDYNRPLDVKWLCRTHHIEEHQRLGWGLGGLVGGKRGGHMTGSKMAKIPGRMKKLGLVGGKVTASIPGHLSSISKKGTHVQFHLGRGIRKDDCELCQALVS